MDKYKNLKLLGKGSYGTVFKIEKRSNNKVYALKQMNISKLRDNYEINNLINELKILCFHNCNYLLKCREIFYENHKINIVTDLAKYSDLSKYIEKYKKNNKKISEKTIWLIFIQCCYGIEYLHEYDIIHRDLKPANILLNDNSSILIADFGISKILENKLSSNTMIGTPYYISPEMYKDKNYDKKIDVWALGCILYELSTLTVPFNANNLKALKHKIIHSNYYHENLNYYSNDLRNMIKYLLDKSVYNRLSIKEIISTKIFKKMEHELQLSNSNKYTVSIDNKIHNKYNLPKYTGNWKNIIEQINYENYNKILNSPKYPSIKKNLNFEENNNINNDINKNNNKLPEIKLNKKNEDIFYKNRNLYNNKYYENIKNNNYDNISKKINNNYDNYDNIPKRKNDNYKYKKNYNDYNNLIYNKYNKYNDYLNKKYNNHENYNSRYNYKNKYNKNYNIINNSKLPYINYSKYY